MADNVENPLDPGQSLKRPLNGEQLEEAHPPQPVLPGDSTVTKSEKLERNGTAEGEKSQLDSNEPAAKRVKLDAAGDTPRVDARDKVKGVALVKPE